MTVNGADSKWTNSGNLYAGNSGSGGTMNVTGGGAVSNNNGYIGYNSGSSGVVTVNGASSTASSKWTNSGDLYVGNFGSGTLNVTGGGTVNNNYGYIGYNSGSSGVVTVDGTGSTWNNSYSSGGTGLYVGYNGNGTLNITRGGTVSCSYATIAENSGSTGVATVDGSGSTWTSSYILAGNGGNGMLNVTGGGTVNSQGYVGANSGTGVATVNGKGSKWTDSDVFYVGYDGNGTLNVTGGGAVSNTTGYIGHDSGWKGVATVDGKGSKWTNSGTLYVGYNGNGTLNVTGGGAVSDTIGYIGFSTGTTGIAMVDGAGSKWTNSGALYVGNECQRHAVHHGRRQRYGEKRFHQEQFAAGHRHRQPQPAE